MARGDSDRIRRLALRRAAKSLLEPLRGLVRDLAEFERLAEADAFGVIRVQAGEGEADYAADALDLIARAVEEAGAERVVEVLVITSPTESIHRAPPIGGKTDDRKKQRVQRRRARQGA